ncbi:DUF2484 family protein [Yoonia sp. SDW83-1]|uniref:DUF2484 family protein n=1 Tax=Yoonia sp. SDW83-1 TaxID=3366945 RepID=UPI00398C3532
MMAPILAICLWIVVAFVMALIPSNDNHWRRAYVLMAIGAPMLVWLIWSGTMIYAVIFLIVAASVLRWPLIYLYRWLRRQLQR